MSIENVDITFQDRRDESPQKVAILWTDEPGGTAMEDISIQELERLIKRTLNKMKKAVPTRPQFISLEKLEAALAAGVLTQDEFNEIVGYV